MEQDVLPKSNNARDDGCRSSQDDNRELNATLRAIRSFLNDSVTIRSWSNVCKEKSNGCSNPADDISSSQQDSQSRFVAADTTSWTDGSLERDKGPTDSAKL